MKAMMAALGLLLSVQAPAEELCGENLRDVTQIINQQFTQLDTGSMVACFQGNWGGITIEMDKPFSFAGANWEACPQESGTILVRKKGSTDAGELTCSEGKLSASNFTGLYAMANGKSFSKQTTAVATGKRGRKN